MKIAIIPARGGSKRIPRKNIKAFGDRPLIAYSLAAARESGVFDHVLVSTDDNEIRQVALDWGATGIIEREKSLADDHVGTSAVVRAGIESFQLNCGINPDYVCCIYATAPFLRSTDLVQAWEKLSNTPAAHYAFSVTSYAFPIQRALRLESLGVEPVDREQIVKRSQDLEECYHDAGQFYWGRCNSWLERKPVFRTHSIPVILPRYRVQDIDTEEDWVRAELMYQAYQAAQEAEYRRGETVLTG